MDDDWIKKNEFKTLGWRMPICETLETYLSQNRLNVNQCGIYLCLQTLTPK